MTNTLYPIKNPQTLIIDGCKVTVNYAAASASGILTDIRKKLIDQYAAQKYYSGIEL